jgi:hypothetical protein
MWQGKTVIVLIFTLAIGFAGGFTLRPAIAPSPATVVASAPTPVSPASSGARGTQYFMAHFDEARQVVAGCRDGSVRGGECANAEEAIIKVDAQERRRRFLGN